MVNEPLKDQISELVTTAVSVGSLAGRLVKASVSLSWSVFLFVISCGSMVRWKRAEVPRREIRVEVNPSIPKTYSREILAELALSSEATKKRSWSMCTEEREDIIMIPSQSVDQSELMKIEGVALYEERQLCCLFYLRNPNVKLVYVTGNPIEPVIVHYYLTLLEENSGISVENARKRLLLLNCNDNSESALSSKILQRPKLIEKIKSFVDPKFAYMVCFISSNLERELAIQLGVPLFSNDPALSYWGSKSGSRRIFEEAHIALPKGTALAYDLDTLAEHIVMLFREEPSKKIVVKLNVGFSGEGNAILRTNTFCNDDLKDSVTHALVNSLEFAYTKETWDSYYAKILMYGAIAENWVEDVYSSPSCQGIISPYGKVEVISTHEQKLLNDLVYLGCTFPCEASYRKLLMENTQKIGEILAAKNCRESFSVDFVTRNNGDEWEVFAVEINLRWGGTTHPLKTTKFITNSELNIDGILVDKKGNTKCYVGTDNVKNNVYKGLNPEDFLDLVNSIKDLQFNAETGTGVVFHMLTSISVYGKFGFVAIGNSEQESEKLYHQTISILEKEASLISSRKQFISLNPAVTEPN